MQHLGGPGYQGGGPPPSNRPCREFSATGRCKWGANCRYSHDTGPGQQDMLRGPPSHRGNACSQWLSTGRCTYGDSCKFSHPEPPMQQFGGPSIPKQQQPAQLPALHMQQYGGLGQLPPPPQQQVAQPQRPPSGGDVGQQQQQPPLRQHSSKPPTPGQTPAHQQQLEPAHQPSPQTQPPPQQGPPPAYCFPKPGKPTYVDCVRAICEALNIGHCGELVTDETRVAAMRSFCNRTLFRESRFADSVEQYLPG